ncbi:hypothetical protein DMC61_38895 [Amycolatopsis sp. WAC 04169]|nr:hypothetical protein DMC61_38895 [Amycolatopsis sp. WAC 04169]
MSDVGRAPRRPKSDIPRLRAIRSGLMARSLFMSPWAQARSVKASLRDPESLKEAFTDLRLAMPRAEVHSGQKSGAFVRIEHP